ncbi:hypothetical protein M8J77_000372 [Diaphorina citri]|nr:hypothetical protein M8J77_000372 [Diaphorina citri]
MNKDKIQFKKNKVTILGYLVSKNGTQIDPQRTEAISKMKTPTDKTELLQFLGMVKYFARFIPNISDITSPLRELTKKDVHWDWKDEHEIAVKRLKDLLVSAPILCHYESKLETTIQTDASKDGLGSCLLQNDRVVAYASRSLTETEKRYAQIEKELLAIVFACEKFHYYIYGKKTKIHTDHKPLVTIVKKNIAKISPRMQRMILKLIAYDLEVEYLPGTQMYIADTLSRNFIASSKEENSDCDMYIHELSPCYPASQEKLQMVLEATLKDPDILQVIRLVQNNSWPNGGKQLNENVKMFFRIKDTLTTIDGLLFKDNKIVIPRNLQTHMLNLFHESHLGMSKIKAKARECVYWPNMNKNIEDFIRKCDICQKYSNENPKMPMISHEVPTRAWEKLGTDVMEYNGINYLVVYDYFSKWIEVKRLRNKDSVELIDKFMQIFSYHGAPDFVVSDNMPFSSRMFQKFFDEWNIRSITSSPRYPRGNGLSEKAVNIAKDMLKKNGDKLDLALLQYRNYPIVGIGYSPAQMLFNRNLKEKIPVRSSALCPKVIDPEEIRNKIAAMHDSNKKYYDRTARPLPDCNVGDDVLIKTQPQRPWERGVVIQHHNTPRSYVVKQYGGRVFRRSRQHLKPSFNTMNNKERDNDDYSPDYDDYSPANYPRSSALFSREPETLLRSEPEHEQGDGAYQLRDRSTLKQPDRYQGGM